MLGALHQSPETVLSDVLVGASVCGVRFGTPQLLLAPREPIGECFVNLSSAWYVYSSRPAEFPAEESGVPELTQDQELLSLSSLQFERVYCVEILRPMQHLVLTFSNGAVLYINGHNPGPEPWGAGLNAFQKELSVWVIALSDAEPIVHQPFALVV
jgi:hypothetical protein